MNRIDLGPVSAYALAKEQGYEGTEEEFAIDLANAAAYAASSAASAEAAQEAAEGAQSSATAAANSQTASAGSASSAANSATAANTSANDAATYASASAASAEAAQEAAEGAQSFAAAAANSQTASAGSASSAANSATAANTSANDAATYAASSAASAEAAQEAAGYSKEGIDQLILATLNASNYKSVMGAWFLANGVNAMMPAGITELCDKWYTNTRTGWDGYTTFYHEDVSAVSAGERGGDNAGLSCTPSTDAVANQDDYTGIPLFACVDVNWEIDAETLEPVITAIDGVAGNFVRDNPGVYVGVMQMAGYHWYTEKEGGSYTHGYTDTNSEHHANIAPLPEAIRVDGSMRPWVVHGKYMAQKTSTGALTCCAGVIPSAWMSHNALHTAASANGSLYSGGTTADIAFLVLMTYIKYASLTLDGILQGCCNCNYQYYAQVSEENVNRILIPTSHSFEVGMSVLIGNYASSTDRGSLYNITGQGGATITAIETVAVNGVNYAAIYVDSDSFSTAANGEKTAGTTYISSFHWKTGSCDEVRGNDGSPTSCTSGKYPAKLQGIEFMSGGYEVLGDVILSLYAENDAYWYQPYITRRTANRATTIAANYEGTGIAVQQPNASSWQYIKRLGYDPATGVMFPKVVGGSSSTYVRDAFYMNANTTGTREWLAFGYLITGSANGGLSCLYGFSALSNVYWYSLARLSPNGNRGEWAA